MRQVTVIRGGDPSKVVLTAALIQRIMQTSYTLLLLAGFVRLSVAAVERLHKLNSLIASDGVTSATLSAYSILTRAQQKFERWMQLLKMDRCSTPTIGGSEP